MPLRRLSRKIEKEQCDQGKGACYPTIATPARVEEMMMNTRMQLLKIPEVLNIKCGKRVDPELQWPFFIAIDFESMDKFAIFREDPIFVKFMEEIIKPNTADSLNLDFEMDPGKDVRFS